MCFSERKCLIIFGFILGALIASIIYEKSGSLKTYPRLRLNDSFVSNSLNFSKSAN